MTDTVGDYMAMYDDMGQRDRRAFVQHLVVELLKMERAAGDVPGAGDPDQGRVTDCTRIDDMIE